MQTFISYLFMVVLNWYFLSGIILGGITRVYFGGPVISFITGVTVSIIIIEIFKYWNLS